MKLLAILILAFAAASANADDSISARRFIDAQGVEVIHNRTQAPAAGAVKQITDATERAGSVKLAAPAADGRDSRFQVSAREQSARDLDRVAILEQELDKEMRAIAEISRLSAALAGTKPSAPDSVRIKERMNDHQKNVAALQAELRRATGGR